MPAIQQSGDGSIANLVYAAVFVQLTEMLYCIYTYYFITRQAMCASVALRRAFVQPILQ